MKFKLALFSFFFLLLNFFIEAEMQIKGIDFIYLINLDKRADRLENSLEQLSQYDITPHRFSAIYGKDLTNETLLEISMRYKGDMGKNQWAKCFENDSKLEYVFLNEQALGKHIFNQYM